MVVPGDVGPLRPVEGTGRRRTPDGIDDLLDDLLGGDDERGPGSADVALVAGGVVLITASVLAGLPGWVLVAGLLATVLGSILPLRAAWRRVREVRSAARRREVLGSGTVLVVVDPAVRALTRLHASLVAARPGPGATDRVAEVAHHAVLEVASLLDGRAQPTGEERAYVQARVAALGDLAAAVEETRVPVTSGDESDVAPGTDAGPDGDHLLRRARLEAREEVDRLSGIATPSRAADLADELRRGRG